MSKFDVRAGDGPITELVIAEKNSNDYGLDKMIKNPMNGGGVRIVDSDSSRYMVIKDREHAENLIKGIEKARELGWLK